MKTRALKILWAVLAVALASLACTVNIGGPTPPAPPPTPNPQALDDLKAAWKQAVAQASSTGEVTVTITAEQLTALLAAKLADDPDAFFQQPQVILQDNQLIIYGQAHQSKITANVRVALSVTVDEEGVPRFHLDAADFGPLPVPPGLLDGLSDMLNESLTGKIVPQATGFRLESIAIGNGTMTLRGHLH